MADRQLDEMQLKLASSQSPTLCPKIPYNRLWRFPLSNPQLCWGLLAADLHQARQHSFVRYKRLEKGHFISPQAKDGAVSLTSAQLACLLDGI